MYFTGVLISMIISTTVWAVIPVQSISVDGEEASDGLGDLVVGPFIFLYENVEDQGVSFLLGVCLSPHGFR